MCMRIGIGSIVKFTGCDELQHRWGSHTGNFKDLTIGEIYTVKCVEVHSWHTKVFLEGSEGSFNSVCFEEVK